VLEAPIEIDKATNPFSCMWFVVEACFVGYFRDHDHMQEQGFFISKSNDYLKMALSKLSPRTLSLQWGRLLVRLLPEMAQGR
jgi:hypothetical protein